MSSPNVSGPAYVYFSRTAASSYPANSASIYFLGTGERAPSMQLNPKWEPVINDVGGLVPIDFSYQGEDGILSIVLNKWNEVIYAAIAQSAKYASARGSELWKDIGTLAQLEGWTFHLWVHFPYASAKSFSSSLGMPNGYHFPACRLENHLISPGTSVNRRQLLVNLDRAFNETANSSNSGFMLYDHTMTYIPSVPPTVATGVIS